MKHFDPQLSGSTVASGSMSIDNHVLPTQDKVYDLGSDSFNWRNLYGTASHAITASYALNASSGGGSTPAGTISSSQQIGDFGFISSSGVISGSQQIEDLGFISGSLVAGTNITINQVGGDFEISASTAGGSVPDGTISGSQQIEDFGFISGSLVAGTNIIINQVGGDFEISSSAAGDSIPSGTISGSQQIEDLGFITSSAGTIDTGSFYVSSSISGDTIKFTQGDNTTETVTIETVNTSSGVINPNTNELIKIWIGSLADYNAFRVTGATTSNPSSATSVTFTVSSSSIFTLNGRVFVTGTSPGNTTKTEGVISSIPDSTTVVISFPTPYTSASTSGYTLSIHDPNILYFVR